MPVQIPQLQRTDASLDAAPKSFQIDERVPDVASGLSKVTQAIKGVSDEQENYVLRQKEYAAQTKSQQIANQKEIWASQQKGQLRKLEGDPTQPYADYQDQSSKLNDSLMDQAKDMDARTQALIKQKLAAVDRRIGDNMAVQQGMQWEKYSRQVAIDGVNNIQSTGIDSIAGIVADSVSGGKQGYDNWRGIMTDQLPQPLIQQGRQNGLVTQAPLMDADGKPVLDEKGQQVMSDVYSPILQAKIKEAQGQYVSNAVQTLSRQGKTDLAKQLLEDNSDYLSAKQKMALSQNNDEVNVRNQGVALADKLRHMDPGDAIKQLDNDASLDDKPQLRMEAKKAIETNSRIQEQTMKQEATRAYQTAYAYLSKTNFVTVDQMENDQYAGALLQKLRTADPEKADALEQKILNPKFTDPAKFSKAMEAYQNGEFAGMNRARLNELQGGSNSAQRNQLERYWDQANLNNDNGKSYAMGRNMNHQLEIQMEAAGQLKKVFGRYDSASQKKLAQAQVDMADIVAAMPPGSTFADQNARVKAYVGQGLKAQAFSGAVPKDTPKVISDPSAPPAKATPPPNAGNTDADVLKNTAAAKVAFAQDKKRPWTKDDGVPALKPYWPKPGDQ